MSWPRLAVGGAFLFFIYVLCGERSLFSAPVGLYQA